MTVATSPTTAQPKSPVELQLQRIYTRGIHFETYPVSGKVQAPPRFDLNTDVSTVALSGGAYEVILTLLLTAHTPAAEESAKLQPIWRLQFQQAGVYGLGQLADAQREQAVYQFCANQLYQYACVYASTLVQQAGFPPVILMPINFLQAYQQQKAQATQKDVEAKTAAPAH